MHADLDAYLGWGRAVGLSSGWTDATRWVLTRLTTFLHHAVGVTDWTDVEPRHLWAFLTAEAARTTRRGSPRSPAGLRAAAGVIRRFFHHLHQSGRLVSNPAGDLRLPVAEPPPVRVLTPDQVVRLLAQPDTTTPLGLRDRALLEVLYTTAARLAEAWALDVSDADLTGGRLTIRQGKGGRDRVVPLVADTRAWLTAYLTDARPPLAVGLPRRPRPTTPSPALWVSAEGRRFSYSSIDQMIRRHAARAELTASAHDLRRSCATHLLDNGADVRLVARLLGHGDLSAVQRYTRVDLPNLTRRR